MLINYFVSRDAFIDVCWDRQLGIQEEEDGTLYAFVGEEYMGKFLGTEGYLLDETMVRPGNKNNYIQ